MERKGGGVGGETKGLRAYIAKLETRLNQRDQNEQRQAAAEESRLQAETSQDVEQWSADKPHYGAVRGKMSVLVASGEANNLDEAYDMACYADPVIRKAVLADKARTDEAARKTEEGNRLAETSRHTSAAKRAASIQVGGGSRRTVPVAHAGKWDNDDYLSGVFDRVQEGR